MSRTALLVAGDSVAVALSDSILIFANEEAADDPFVFQLIQEPRTETGPASTDDSNGERTVISMAFSADRRYLVVIDSDKTIRVLCTTERRCVATRRMPKKLSALLVAPLPATALAATGTAAAAAVAAAAEEAVLVGDKTGDVYALRLPTLAGNPKLLLGHTASIITGLALVPPPPPAAEGKAAGAAGAVEAAAGGGWLLASSDRDEKVRLSRWPATGLIDSFCLGHTEYVAALAALPATKAQPHSGGGGGGGGALEGRLVVTGSGDGTLRVWCPDASTEEEEEEEEGAPSSSTAGAGGRCVGVWRCEPPSTPTPAAAAAASPAGGEPSVPAASLALAPPPVLCVAVAARPPGGSGTAASCVAAVAVARQPRAYLVHLRRTRIPCEPDASRAAKAAKAGGGDAGSGAAAGAEKGGGPPPPPLLAEGDSVALPGAPHALAFSPSGSLLALCPGGSPWLHTFAPTPGGGFESSSADSALSCAVARIAKERGLSVLPALMLNDRELQDVPHHHGDDDDQGQGGTGGQGGASGAQAAAGGADFEPGLSELRKRTLCHPQQDWNSKRRLKGQGKQPQEGFPGKEKKGAPEEAGSKGAGDAP